MKFSIKPIYAILLVIITALLINVSFKNWEKEQRVIEYDVHNYYFYLPATFIYNDLKLEKSDYKFGDNYHLFWVQNDCNGNKVNKETCGLSILYAPFFFVGHFAAKIFNYSDNGFSEPYKILLLLSSVFYLFIGLIFIKKILNQLSFDSITISIVILLLGLGTNLLTYSSQSATDPHVYSFCLFAGFIYNTIMWYKEATYNRTLFLGLLYGLITLINPVNSLILLFFLLYNINSFSDIKERFNFLFTTHYKSVVRFVVFMFVVWIPQFLYWKLVSGDWFYSTQRDERFYFLDPEIINGLFSFRKGWLVYTPIMVFAVIGMFFLKEQLKGLKWGVTLFTIINIYIVFSWWCWWYGGTHGQKALIESYALLVIPLAAFVRWMVQKKSTLLKSVFGLIAAFFIWLNIVQVYQRESGALHYSGMSYKLYVKQFGKIDKVEDFEEHIDWIDVDAYKYR